MSVSVERGGSAYPPRLSVISDIPDRQHCADFVAKVFLHRLIANFSGCRRGVRVNMWRTSFPVINSQVGDGAIGTRDRRDATMISSDPSAFDTGPSRSPMANRSSDRYAWHHLRRNSSRRDRPPAPGDCSRSPGLYRKAGSARPRAHRHHPRPRGRDVHSAPLAESCGAPP
jgi:hypothetical protein